MINLPDMCDLVTDRRYLADSRLKPLLCVARTPQTATSFLPSVRREEQRWNLTEVKVVNDAQRL